MSREFFQPDTLIKALELKRDHENSSLLAGGTDLVVAIRNGNGPEGSIIDLSKARELKGIEASGDTVRIGSMTTFSEIEDSEVLKNTAIMLCEAASAVGSPQIRNRGTIGGNICNASAAADGIAPLLCLDAEVELQSIAANGEINTRVIPLESFLVDSGKTSLLVNEILTGILFRRLPPDALSAFRKIGRRNALAIARINGCCAFQLKSGAAENIRFALGASTSKPERIRAVEEFLTGRELTGEALSEAGKRAAEYVLKQTGIRSSSGYKLPVIEKFTASLIQDAVKEREDR
jgi:CO/xanthine dehydrogenase FAD-binding subunit